MGEEDPSDDAEAGSFAGETLKIVRQLPHTLQAVVLSAWVLMYIVPMETETGPEAPQPTQPTAGETVTCTCVSPCRQIATTWCLLLAVVTESVPTEINIQTEATPSPAGEYMYQYWYA